MALSLGTLFVKLNADPSQLTRGLSEAATKIEQFGNRLKQTSEKLTQLGVAMSAAGVGAVAVAAQFDSGVKSSLDELKSTTAAISVEIGRSFIPLLCCAIQASSFVPFSILRRGLQHFLVQLLLYFWGSFGGSWGVSRPGAASV